VIDRLFFIYRIAQSSAGRAVDMDGCYWRLKAAASV